MTIRQRSQIHDHLVVDHRGSVAVMRIDREQALGALSQSMLETFGQYLRELRNDRKIEALVVTGTGRGFIAGADLDEYQGATQADFDSYQRLSRRVFEELEHLPQPTLAAVNGYAFGGGFELALCCDLIVASTEARFALPEIKLGLIPGGGGPQRLSRTVGTRLTKDLVMTGRVLRAEEADKHNLLARLTPPHDLLPTAHEVAQQVSAGATLAVHAAKRLIDDGIQQSLGAALTTEQSVLSYLFTTYDGQEGIAAFTEKREPRFEGR